MTITQQLLAELTQAHAAIEALRQVTNQAQVDAACSWLVEQGFPGDLKGNREQVIEEAGGKLPSFRPMYLRGRTWHLEQQ